MALTERASDWRAAAIAQVGGSAGLGGGVYWVSFRSSQARAREMFMFIGGGIGAGGSVGGANLTPGEHLAIECEQPFSVTDLNMSAGRITIAGASLAAGYGLMWVSAFNLSGPLFSSQYIGGWNAGVALNAQTLVGYWRSMTLASRDAQEAVRGAAYRHHGA